MRAHLWMLLAAILLLGSLPAIAQVPGARPTGPVTDCVTSECHGDMLSGEVLHGPVAQKKCEACHTLTDAAGHGFELTHPEESLCSFCHVQSQRTVVHYPVEQGECVGCHDPHGSDHRFLLLEDPAGGLCFGCHDEDDYTSKEYVHGPVASGACVVCHEAHSSWNPKLLVKQGQELCMLCHDETLEVAKMARHSHKPVLEGRCAECHDPHASNHKGQLRTKAPELCYSCHEHEKIKILIESSTHVHGAIDTEESCSACHGGHGSALPKLLSQSLLNLCLSCHDEPLKTPDGRTITDMAALLKENPNHHGPVRRADCSACHDPHASPNFMLLAKEYPEKFYASFDLKNYELCFTCHTTELVTEENGQGVTGFRDGDLNLHYAHVHKEKKGRTCRACHEVHASKRPFHVRERVPFGSGGWQIEINFESRPDGGRCAPGCHRASEYKRGEGSLQPPTKAGLKAGREQ
ncbi:MAG: cytochrome c3 family protein [Planctomycetota bacterium]